MISLLVSYLALSKLSYHAYFIRFTPFYLFSLLRSVFAPAAPLLYFIGGGALLLWAAMQAVFHHVEVVRSCEYSSPVRFGMLCYVRHVLHVPPVQKLALYCKSVHITVQELAMYGKLVYRTT